MLANYQNYSKQSCILRKRLESASELTAHLLRKALVIIPPLGFPCKQVQLASSVVSLKVCQEFAAEYDSRSYSQSSSPASS